MKTKLPECQWIAETRMGETVGWLLVNKETGAIVKAITYGKVHEN